MEALASDRAPQGADHVLGVVVGSLDVARLAVAAEGNRARAAPRAEMRARGLEVGVRVEPESAGVVGRAEDEGNLRGASLMSPRPPGWRRRWTRLMWP